MLGTSGEQVHIPPSHGERKIFDSKVPETDWDMGVEPKIGVGPQNGWFIMENPISKWMIWGYHYFWKLPYVKSQEGTELFTSWWVCPNH